MKTKNLSLLIVAALFFSLTAMAQKPGNRDIRPDRKELMMKKRFMANNDRESIFTDEQKESIKEIRLNTAKQVKPLKNELGELNARQKTLTTAADADMNAIYANIEKMAEVKTKIAKLMAKQHQEIRSLLTEEQLLKFDMRRDMAKKKIRRPVMRDRDRLPERYERQQFHQNKI